MPILYHNHGQPKQNLFGESRTVNFLGLGAVGSAIKGMVGEVKGGGKEVVEKAGTLKRFGNWMTTADTLPGYILKSPLILTRKAVEGTIFGVKTINGAGLAVGKKIGSIIKEPIQGGVKLAKELGQETGRAAYHLTLAPLLEIMKSNCIDVPKRALVDQFRTGIKMILGTAGTFIGKSVEAIKEVALSPFSIVSASRKAIKSALWDAPKSLLKGEFKEAGKHLVDSPLEFAKGALKAPMAVAGVPYHTGMQLALGLTETAMNGAGAFAAPVEGMVNAYRAMGKSTDLFDYVKQKTSVDMSESYRGRFKSLFSMRSPLAFSAA